MSEMPPAPPPPTYADNGGGSSNGSSNGSRGGGGGFDRVPPHSLEAEVSVLGAALLSRNAATEVVEILRGDDFYRTAHRVVFEGVQELMHKGEPCDAVTLLDWLARNGRLDEVGGAGAVHDLTGAVPTAANAVHYARIVKEKALLRRLIEAGTKVAALGYESPDDAQTVVDQAEGLIYEIAETGTTSEYSQLKDLLNESFEQIEKLAENRSEVTGLSTGFNDLDRLTAGLQPQNLVIVAARPAMGKCVTGATRVTLSSGEVARIDELVERGLADGPIDLLSLDADRALVSASADEFHDNGVKPVFDLRTRLGRAVTATDNHPFLTPTGWKDLAELEPGDLVAVPRELPVFGDRSMSPAETKALGYLLGDGSLTGTTPAVTSESPAIIRELTELAPAFGTEVHVTDKAGTGAKNVAFVSTVDHLRAPEFAASLDLSPTAVSYALNDRPGVATATKERVRAAVREQGYDPRPTANFLTHWLRELGVWGTGSHDKAVPAQVFQLPRQQLATFLSRLYATDGSAWVAEEHGYYGISYTSVSERLVRDVQHLLLRFGIVARLRSRKVTYTDSSGVVSHRPAFELEIRDAVNCRRFLDEIGIFSKEQQCERVRAAVDARTVEHTNTDLLPVEVWDDVLADKGDRSWADVSAATGRPRNHNWHVGERRPSRRLIGELAEALDSDRLRSWANSDVYWDEIVAIEPAGEERVYDLTVPGLHNFVADDVIVHNSSLALNLAQYVTTDTQRPAIIFSLEMSKLEIVNRLLASEARIDSNRIKTGRLEDADWRKLGDALGRLSEAPLFIDDTPSITLMEIRSKCRRLKQKSGLDLIIIDYLQLMQSHRRVDSRQQEVAEISRGLKMLAKELNVPVIALSQLSRNTESRTDKRPQLADLRESGSIEQDADIVGFIYRDEVYDEDTPDKGIAELIIAKHRNGATGTVKLAFLNHLTKFANLARGPGAGGGPGGGGGGGGAPGGPPPGVTPI